MPTLPNPRHAIEWLDEAARIALEGACAGVALVAADTDLVRQGEATDHLHLLVEGWACRTKVLEDGRRQIPAVLLPGDVCDLDGLEVPCLSYGVATLTPCQVATWPHHALAAVMEEHPAVRVALLRLALAENMMMTQAAVVLGRLCARERVAHLLCELLARLEAAGRAEPDGCDLPLTQAEMADVLGLSGVHVNRTLQELRGAGLIRLEGGRLTVLDREGLRRAGQFQPDHLQAARTVPSLPLGPAKMNNRRRAAGLDEGARPGSTA